MAWTAALRAALRHQPRDDTGDTLIELLIAIVVLGIAVVAILGALTTTIMGSGTYRHLATMDTVLKSAASEVTTKIESSPNAFICPASSYKPPTSTYTPTTWSREAETRGLPSGYTASVSPLQYWTGSGTATTCTPNSPGEPLFVTVKLTGQGGAASVKFIVDDPLAPQLSAQTEPAGKLVFVTLPSNPAVGEQFAPPIAVAVETSAGTNIITGDISHMYLTASLSGTTTTRLSSACSSSGVEYYGVFTFSNCSVDAAGKYTVTAHDTTDDLTSTPPATITVGDVPEIHVTNTKNVVAGQQLTFWATVTGPTGASAPSGALKWTIVSPTGATVTYTTLTPASSSNVAKYTFSISSALPGHYSATAAYKGDPTSTPPYEPVTGFDDTAVVTATELTSTTFLTGITNPVTYGSETQTFSGYVKGPETIGYPTGTVDVETSTAGHIHICTAILTSGTGNKATFKCPYLSSKVLSAGSYSVVAHYTGGYSSTENYAYGASTSTPAQPLTVKKEPEKTTTLLTVPSSATYNDEKTLTFHGTVEGQSGAGHPAGSVTVATGTTTICTASSLKASGTDTATFNCSPTSETVLKSGTHTHIVATYTPGSPSSTTQNVVYTTSHSSTQTLKVKESEKTTTSLTVPASATSGKETSLTFHGTVEGQSDAGHPEGSVTVATGTTTICTASSLKASGTDTATFKCSPTSGTVLSVGTHTHIVATYTPGSPSSTTQNVAYTTSHSSTQTLKVKESEKTMTSLTVPASAAYNDEKTLTFHGTVEGQNDAGHPEGSVTVATGTTTICTASSLTRTGLHTATFKCSPTSGTVLSVGTHTHIVATYTPGSPSSTITDVAYTTSHSSTHHLKVT